MRGGRDVRDDERALWDEAMRDVRRPRVRRPTVSHRKAEQRKAEPVKKVPSPAAPKPAPQVPATRKAGGGFGLDGSTVERLRKGKVEPEATIDLHGLTQDRAHARLVTFIAREYEKGTRCIRVVTGVGSPGPGVLRTTVPRWLKEGALRAAVAGVQEAHRRHGGGGALYVYLRRKRGQ